MPKSNHRQMSILVWLLLLTPKFLTLPSLLFKYSKNDSWIVLAILMLVDIFTVFLIVAVLKRNKEKNFYDYLKHNFGTIFARIICFIFALYSMIYIANIIKTLNVFLVQNLYEAFDWYLFALPLVAVVGFMVYKGLRNISRSFEIFIYLIIACILLVIITGIKDADFSFFLPILSGGAKPLLHSAFHNASGFGSVCILFLMFGEFDFSHEKKSNLYFSAIFAFTIAQAFYWVFYGTFGSTGIMHNFAISDLTQFSTGQNSLDQIQWLVVIIWLLAQILQISVFVFTASRAIQHTFSFKNNIVPIAIILSLMVLWAYFGNKNLKLSNFFNTVFVSIFMIVVQYGITYFILIFDAIKTRLKSKKTKNNQKNKTKLISVEAYFSMLKRRKANET